MLFLGRLVLQAEPLRLCFQLTKSSLLQGHCVTHCPTAWPPLPHGCTAESGHKHVSPARVCGHYHDAVLSRQGLDASWVLGSQVGTAPGSSPNARGACGPLLLEAPCLRWVAPAHTLLFTLCCNVVPVSSRSLLPQGGQAPLASPPGVVSIGLSGSCLWRRRMTLGTSIWPLLSLTCNILRNCPPPLHGGHSVLGSHSRSQRL